MSTSPSDDQEPMDESIEPEDEILAEQWLEARFGQVIPPPVEELEASPATEFYERFSSQELRERKRIAFKTKLKSINRRDYPAFKKGIKDLFPTTDSFYLLDKWKDYLVNDVLCRSWNAFFDKGDTSYANGIFKEWLIEDRVAINLPICIGINGYTGCGKSYLAQVLADYYEWLRKAVTMFHVNPGDLLDTNYIHSPAVPCKECLARAPGVEPSCKICTLAHAYLSYSYNQAKGIIEKTMQPGDVCIHDEATQKEHGQGSGIEMDNIKNMLDACMRRLCLSLIYCSPLEVHLGEIHCYIDIIATNRQTKQTLALLSIPSKKKGDVATGLGVAIFDAWQPDEFARWYSDHSRGIKAGIRAAGGGSASQFDYKKIVTLSELLESEINKIDANGELTDKQKEQLKTWVFDPKRKGMPSVARGITEIATQANAIEAVVDFTRSKKEHPIEVVVQDDQDAGTAVVEEKAELSDAAIIQQEFDAIMHKAQADNNKLPVGEIMRAMFLKKGLNVNQGNIINYQCGKITIDDLVKVTKDNNDLARARAKQDELDALVAAGMNAIFNIDPVTRLVTMADVLGEDELEAAWSSMCTASTTSDSLDPAPSSVGGQYSVNIDATLEKYRKQQPAKGSKAETLVRQAAIFKRRWDGALPATIMAEFTDLKSTDGVNWIWKHVLGWVSNEVGHGYEPWHERVFKEQHPDVEHGECEGIKGSTFPDNVFYYKNGNIAVYSIKCETMDGTVSKKIAEFNAEIEAATKLEKEHQGSLVKCYIHYFDIRQGDSIDRELDFHNPPVSVKFSRDKAGHLQIMYNI